METTWSKIQENLEKILKPGIFQVWIKPLQGEFRDDCLFLRAPNEFVASWVRDRLMDVIEKVACEALGTEPEICLSTSNGGSTRPQTPVIPSTPSPAAALPLDYVYKPSSFSNWRFSFDDFLVGPCNQLAYVACTSLCQETMPADSVFLCSGPGLGKTHLIQAIGNFYCGRNASRPIRVGYVSSEEFTNQMITAIKARELDTFKARYRDSIDILLLEDVHFFQGKEKTQEELLSTIKSLESNGKKVVFTCSFLPKELVKLDSQLASYFSSGFLATIQKPDYAFRLEIVQAKARRFQIDIPKDVGAYVAKNISSDIRQLESCLKNMALKARLLNQGITMDIARDTLSNYAREILSPDIEAITTFVSHNFDIPYERLRSRSRKRNVVLARNTAFYLARQHTDLSLKDIGQRFNRRHSTVLKGITNVEREIVRQTSLGRQLTSLMERMELG